MTIPTEPGIYVRKDPDWNLKGWTSVPNTAVRNPEISWDAKGALAWFASHSETHKITTEDLADAGPRGRNHAYEMVRELERWGWLSRDRHRSPATGRYDVHIYRLHPEPLPVEQRTYRTSRVKPRRMRMEGETGSSEPLPGRSGAATQCDLGPGETASSEPLPGRSGSGAPLPDRPGTGRSGIPYKEEKNKLEEQARFARPAREPGAAPSSPDPDADPLSVELALTRRSASRRDRTAAQLDRTAHTLAARRVVQTYAESCSYGPTREVFAALAVHVDAALRDHIPEHVIALGLSEWGERGLHPSTLPSCIHAAGNRRPNRAAEPPARVPTTTRKINAILALRRPEPESEARWTR